MRGPFAGGVGDEARTQAGPADHLVIHMGDIASEIGRRDAGPSVTASSLDARRGRL
jgi:hypothetical protein